MKLTTYANKAVLPRYICPPCLSKHPELTAHSIGLYVAATCCKCGAVGTFLRLTNAAGEKATETK
jgi:hypothetical protein